ncbi:DUF2628 domain-containing protein [Companilactobacillus mishanensis]|uniref:DUF2628 domain-containing protein n=1 Tax=Companilactobacillus mishanensis TaxID=2486008 RepID=A0A5P0ZKZ9_9LACO|nr:DUF2628 domain-containing protein [Companilactobacillus mishanensis]MQS44551.1 DUF2628 domain-containing protein [Companilactobacillus mishanensis]MQS53347.1 DUF2628 domain-containing protein [Companilactobacillus mishanensis]MQS88789.1 DUF2628 domain-containing protein [Companilactobacillus mishanensis]
MMVNLTNSNTKDVKQVKVGFSWTTFFFGFIPAIFRWDLKWFLIILIIEIIASIPTLGFGFSVVGIIFSFFYNRLYINDLIKKGYRPSDEESKKILSERRFEF